MNASPQGMSAVKVHQSLIELPATVVAVLTFQAEKSIADFGYKVLEQMVSGV